jgi:hypothetical protein
VQVSSNPLQIFDFLLLVENKFILIIYEIAPNSTKLPNSAIERVLMVIVELIVELVVELVVDF